MSALFDRLPPLVRNTPGALAAVPWIVPLLANVPPTSSVPPLVSVVVAPSVFVPVSSQVAPASTVTLSKPVKFLPSHAPACRRRCRRRRRRRTTHLDRG